MKKETVKSLTKKFQDWRIVAKDFIHALKYPTTRQLASLSASDPTGRINGMTVPELLAFVNLSALTNERVVLRAKGKEIVFLAEKIPGIFTPLELLQ